MDISRTRARENRSLRRQLAGMVVGTVAALALGVGGGVAPAQAVPNHPNAAIVATSSTGLVYSVSQTSGLLRLLRPNGTSSVLAGAGPAGLFEGCVDDVWASSLGPMTSSLGGVQELTVDRSGNLLATVGFMADSTERQALYVFARATGTFYGRNMTLGKVYRIMGLDCYTGHTGGIDVAFGDQLSLDVDSQGWVVAAGRRASDRELVVIPTTDGDLYGTPMTALTINTLLTNTWNGEGVVGGDVRVDPAGNIVYTGLRKVGGVRLRTIEVYPLTSGTLYGQTVTAHQRTIIAGGGTQRVDGARAVETLLDDVGQLEIDKDGNLLLGGTLGQVMAKRTGTFYGIPMTRNRIYSVPALAAGELALGRERSLITTALTADPTLYAVSPTATTLYGVSIPALTATPIGTS